MKRYLLVFEDEGSRERSRTNDLKAFVDSLDAGAQMYAFDGHVLVSEDALSNAQEVTDRSAQVCRLAPVLSSPT